MDRTTAVSRAGRRRTTIGHLTVALLLVVAMACGGGDGGNEVEDGQDAAAELDEATGNTADEPEDGSDTTAPDDGEAGAVDACALLEPAEVEEHVGPTSGPEGAAGFCTWENQETFESVTVTIGEPQTATNGLPEESPYDDAAPVEGVGSDARYAPGFGIVEFVAGDRACELQIGAVSIEEGTKRAAAVELAALALGRLGG